MARKDVSPVEVVDAVLGQIERLHPVLNAYCTVTVEQARQDARAAEQKVMRGESPVSIPPFAAGAPAPTEVSGRPVSHRGWHAFTYPFNFSGNPAITLPCGWTATGLLVGLQLARRRIENAFVLRAAAAFEALASWALRPAAG